MSYFSITSVNCRGLNDSKKRKDVFNYLRDLKSSIYCLQDTHCTENEKSSVYAQWGHDILMSAGRTDARGTLILMNNNVEVKISSTKSDSNGNFIITNMLVDNKYNITLVNLYGPNRDDQDFYSNVGNIIEEFGNEFVILCGDWNVVQDFMLDCHNYVKENNPKNRIEIQNLKNKFNLVDPWRVNNPTSKKFTWTRRNPTKQARLDYFLISEELMSILGNVKIIPGYRTDHSIINIEFKINDFERGRGFWRFNNSLLRDKEYILKIKEIINDTVFEYTRPPYVPGPDAELYIRKDLFLDVLLMKIRSLSIYYSSLKAKERKDKKKDSITQIKALQEMYDMCPSQLYSDLLNELQTELEDIRKYELNGLLIRSHCKWIEEGEKPTKYFAALEKRNYINKNISRLINDQGVEINNQNEILHEVKNFYKSLYENKDHLLEEVNLQEVIMEKDVKKVTETMRNKLELDITKKEILEALKLFKNDKSPGTDGFTAEFFKFFWSDIGSYIFNSFKCSLDSGILSHSQTQGIISILPKGQKPREYLKNWRPISLLNVTYKLLSSVLASRMKPILVDIIHENQKGFLAGRYIGENSRLLYDIIHYCNETNTPGLILILDFEKAFDSVSWKFISKVLTFFNFGENFQNAIRTLFNNAKLCVIQNGIFSEFFNMGRGCRQGDPISPYIFILCAEIMGLMIRNNILIEGISVMNKEYKLLQYADDTVLLLKGSKNSIKTALSLVNEYAKYSGLKPNYDKTKCVKIGPLSNKSNEYFKDFEKVNWSQEPFTVLGITYCVNLDNTYMYELNFKPKINEMKLSISAWSRRMLSTAGRITVIKNLILPKITHLLISLPNPPRKHIKEIETIFYNYIWNSKTSRVAKSSIIQSYEKGGLRMICLDSFCKSLKITWIRRFFNDACQSSWKDLIISTFPNILNMTIVGRQILYQLSKTCKNLFWKDVFLSFFELRKCTDSELSILSPIWFNESICINNKYVFYKQWFLKGVHQILHFFNNDGTIMKYEQFCNQYDIKPPFTHFLGIVDCIKKLRLNYDTEIILQNIPYYPEFLRIIRKNKQGSRDFYDIFIDEKWNKPKSELKWEKELDMNVNNIWWKRQNLLFFKITNDVQLRWFQYRIVHRIIATNTYLCKIGIVESELCTFCRCNAETICHLFWECEYVSEIWDNLLVWMKDEFELDIPLNKIDVIFGRYYKYYNIFNIIICIVKRHIYRKRSRKELPSFTGIKREILYYYKCEKFIYTKNCELEKFHVRWARLSFNNDC